MTRCLLLAVLSLTIVSAAAADVRPGPGAGQGTNTATGTFNPDVVIVENINHSVAETGDGTMINWLTGEICDCFENSGYDFNAWSASGDLAFYWWSATTQGAGVTLDGATYAVLAVGDTIGPDSDFFWSMSVQATANWRQEGMTDGYLGFRFDNDGVLNYGYVRLSTNGSTGFPATILSYAYNQAGDPIEIAAPVPAIQADPESIEVSLLSWSEGNASMVLRNIGGETLEWEVDVDAGLMGSRSHDPDLDEVLQVPDFTVVSPFYDGEPQQFTVLAGLQSSGRVVGFSFEGTASGITGNLDYKTDLCLQIQGPDGSSYSVGGDSASIDNCAVNDWGFSGPLTSDGTMSTRHDDVWPFPPGAQDQGDWTLTFVHGWDDSRANPMHWSDVTITLHKRTLEACDLSSHVPWLDVASSSGSIEPGEQAELGLTLRSAGLRAGLHSANVCVRSNDGAGNDVLAVPVLLEIVAPALDLSDDALSAAVEQGGAASLTLTISNPGGLPLEWAIEQPSLTAKSASRQTDFPRKLAGKDDALMAFSQTGIGRQDYVSLDVNNAEVWSTILDPAPPIIYAQTFIDNDFSQHFFISSQSIRRHEYGFFDTESGEQTTLGTLTGDLPSNDWTSAAWDPISGGVYSLGFSPGSGNALYQIDIAQGQSTRIGPISGLGSNAFIIAIAIDSKGLMYGIEMATDALVAINKTDGKAASIGPLGRSVNFAQDMDFDRRNDVLYWAAYSGLGTGDMRTIDTDTGRSTVIGSVYSGLALESFSLAVEGAENCSSPKDVPWLDLENEGGTVLPGMDFTNINLFLSSGGLEVGTYRAVLCISSNDPAKPFVRVPVEFQVQGDRIFRDRFNAPP